MKTFIGQGGRIVIPAQYRKRLGLHPGDEVIVHLDNGGLWILTPRQVLARSQGLVRQHVSAARFLSQELISERREEAARE